MKIDYLINNQDKKSLGCFVKKKKKKKWKGTSDYMIPVRRDEIHDSILPGSRQCY